jgi:hypothetical protein
MKLHHIIFDWGRCPQTPGIYRVPARMAVAVDWRRWLKRGSSSFSRTVQRSRLWRHQGTKTRNPRGMSFSWIRQVKSRGYSPKTSSSRGAKILIALRGGWSRPAIPAAESALGSHPCVALSSAQVLPEWINRNLADNAFAANGDNLPNPVSHCGGSLHKVTRPAQLTSLSWSPCRI